LWYKLAEANGLSGGGSSISAGQTLTIPNTLSNMHNNADTFRPYDANSALGDVQPGTPKPPKKKCAVLGAILLAVVAIAVAAVTAGAAIAVLAPAAATAAGGGLIGGIVAAATLSAPLGALVVAGAVGGAVGSIVSQGLGVATGLQDRFSWKGVALSAIGGAVGAGVGSINPLGISSKFGSAVANAVISSAVTQGIGVATKLQDKFSWAGVAAAGVAAGVGYGVGALLQTESLLSSQSFKNILANLGTGVARVLASAGTRTLIEGSDFGDNVIAGLPDVIGQTIADAFVGSFAPDRPASNGPTNLLEGTPYDNVPETPTAGYTGTPNAALNTAVKGAQETAANSSDVEALVDGQFATPSNGALPTVAQVLAGTSPSQAARKQILDEFLGMSGHIDIGGVIQLDPAFAADLAANPATPAEIAKSRADMVIRTESGDISVAYDFGYTDKKIVEEYKRLVKLEDQLSKFDAAAANGKPVKAKKYADAMTKRDASRVRLESLAQERARDSIVPLAQTKDPSSGAVTDASVEAARLALRHNGIAQPTDALISLVIDRASGKKGVKYAPDVKKGASRAESDVQGFLGFREKFYDGMALTAISISRFQGYAVKASTASPKDQRLTRMRAAASDMSAAINSGHFILMPNASIKAKDVDSVRMEQMGTGATSVIHVYKPGIGQGAREYGFDLFHELFHATTANHAVNVIQKAITNPASNAPADNSNYKPDIRSYISQRAAARMLGYRLSGKATTAGYGTTPTGSGGDKINHNLLDGPPINKIVDNIWQKLKL
jgi:hypothetical protein